MAACSAPLRNTRPHEESAMDDKRLLDLSFRFSMGAEGNDTYTDDPDDPGGPTKYGFALNYNRNILPDKDGNGRIDATDVKLLTGEDARTLYEEGYWRRYGCASLPGPLAFLYADMVFNPGPGIAPKLLQRSLCALGSSVTVDGIIGPATLEAVHAADGAALLVELSAQRLRYYGTRGSYGKYGLGWDRRAARCLGMALGILWGTVA